MIYKNKIIKDVERVELSVKWYNPEKGYGFLLLNQAASLCDIMIHFSHLANIGCSYVKEGDRVICDISHGKSGLQVVRVIEVKFGSSELRTLSSFVDSRRTSFDSDSLEDIEGIIKWYNPDKGYGFIRYDDGRRDIFLHSSVIRAAGYKALEPGIRVLAKVATSERGPEARSILVLLEAEDKQMVS